MIKKKLITQDYFMALIWNCHNQHRKAYFIMKLDNFYWQIVHWVCQSLCLPALNLENWIKRKNSWEVTHLFVQYCTTIIICCVKTLSTNPINLSLIHFFAVSILISNCSSSKPVIHRQFMLNLEGSRESLLLCAVSMKLRDQICLEC